jgi:hypothetical protein
MFEITIKVVAKGFVINMGNDETAFQNTTILELKNKIITEKLFDGVEQMRFIFQGKQLDDSATLGSCDIDDASTIVAVVRSPGGLNVD